MTATILGLVTLATLHLPFFALTLWAHHDALRRIAGEEGRP